jgi:flagellar biosynthesis chaperone FliJ
LRARTEQHSKAEQELNRARLVVERARAQVMKARTELKKIQSISERLIAEERSTEQKRERRSEDEAAQNKYASKRRETL